MPINPNRPSDTSGTQRSLNRHLSGRQSVATVKPLADELPQTAPWCGQAAKVPLSSRFTKTILMVELHLDRYSLAASRKSKSS